MNRSFLRQCRSAEPRALPLLFTLTIALFGSSAPATAHEGKCAAALTAAVCDAKKTVFFISSFDPVGSAVRLEKDLLVTNRHNVADEPMVTVHLKDGKTVRGFVEPTGFDGDLVLVRTPDLPDGPVAKLATNLKADAYYTVGYDLNRRRIWAYDPGKLIALPAPGKPLARLHHTAYTQQGNSGGALVNAKGELVGIVTSGGSGRFEAMPVTMLPKLRNDSGFGFAINSRTLGAAYRRCILALEDRSRDRAAKILGSCPDTGNRQFLDQTAQALGRIRQFDAALKQSRRSVAKDPNAINALIVHVQNLTFAGQPASATPHVRRLIKLQPRDDRLHALAISNGVLSGDQALIDQAFALAKEFRPERVPFLKKMEERVRARPKRR